MPFMFSQVSSQRRITGCNQGKLVIELQNLRKQIFMFSDSIADMLTRIRNGYMSKKETVTIPYSKVKEAIAQVLMKNGYLKESDC